MLEYVVGVDPGQLGGVCVLSRDGELVLLIPMPMGVDGVDTYELSKIDSSYGFDGLVSSPGVQVRRVFVEKVGAIQGSGAKSAFTFGRNYEAVLSWCKVAKLPYELVDPKVWKKAVLPGTKKDKQAAIDWVSRVYPSFVHKGHDGMCDACCIAEYGRRLVF